MSEPTPAPRAEAVNVIAVFIVDDHAVVRQGVRAALEARPDFSVVGEAESGAEAVARIAECLPDVVLMDLLMEGGMDGVEATRQVRAVSPRTQVVVLTSYHDDEHIFPALRAGAISYLLKSVKMDELARAIRLAARGEATLHPQVAARVVQELQAPRKESQGPIAELTERELEVLRLIANGLNNNEITARLVLSEHTVKGHVSNILSKLHLADRTQAAVLAWRAGLMRRDEG
jgi:NarL family two-component system response regulator LiaR